MRSPLEANTEIKKPTAVWTSVSIATVSEACSNHRNRNGKNSSAAYYSICVCGSGSSSDSNSNSMIAVKAAVTEEEESLEYESSVAMATAAAATADETGEQSRSCKRQQTNRSAAWDYRTAVDSRWVHRQTIDGIAWAVVRHAN